MEKLVNIPAHVSIIMDGNGRWARERGLERTAGHIEGVESVRACTEAAVEAGVKYLSLYAFSEENWNRPQEEVDTLMSLMFKSMMEEMPNFSENGIRFMVLGNRERLSDGLNATIDSCMEKTSGNTALTLILFLSYSGKWDILQAASRFARDVLAHPDRADELLSMDADGFSRYLVTGGIPDPARRKRSDFLRNGRTEGSRSLFGESGHLPGMAERRQRGNPSADSAGFRETDRISDCRRQLRRSVRLPP